MPIRKRKNNYLRNTLLVLNTLSICLIVGGGVVLASSLRQSELTFDTNTVLGVIEEGSRVNEDVVFKPASVSLETTFFGDVFWGRRMKAWAEASELGVAYPFSGLNTLQNDSNWIANLECPTTNETLSKYQEETLLKFNCPDTYLPEAAKYFDVFSFANNHSDNLKEVNGLARSRLNLEKHGIQYFGHYDNAVKTDICEVVSLKVGGFKFENPDISGKDKQKEALMPIALCGYHNVFGLPTDDQIAVIGDYSKYLPTIVLPHHGAEYKTSPDSLQQRTFKAMVDAGADAVLSGHPHTIQPIEIYNNKVIAYSLGNFIFDQQANQEVTTGLGVFTEIEFKYDDNLASWLDLASDCKAFKDNCLSKAKERGLSKPEYSIKYDIIATDSSNKLTKKADQNKYDFVVNRTRWEAVPEEFKVVRD